MNFNFTVCYDRDGIETNPIVIRMVADDMVKAVQKLFEEHDPRDGDIGILNIVPVR